jgi:2-keto-3-deoxy-L-rhamnonate aldolase RhmA
VRDVVQQMRYPPLGVRGSALERGLTGCYGDVWGDGKRPP